MHSVVNKEDLSENLKWLLHILIVDDNAVSKALMGLEEKVKDIETRLNDPDAYKRQ